MSQSKNIIDLRTKNRPEAPRKDPQPRPAPTIQTKPLPLGKRVSPVRVRRRRNRIVVAGVLLLLVAGAIYGVHWASYLPRYSIQTVTVTGAQEVDPSQIQQYVEATLESGARPFLSPDNIFVYDGKAISQALVANFPRIRSVQISRTSPLSTDLVVAVTERQPLALWCSDATQTDCYQMDNTGYIFASAAAPVATTSTSTTADASSTPPTIGASLGEYVFYGPLGALANASSSSATATSSPEAAAPAQTSGGNPISQTFAGAHVAGMYALLQLLQQDGFSPESATVEDGSSFEVPLQQGFSIKVSFGADPQQVVQDLQLVLASSALSGKENQLEYVDLRFGDRVYYKLQDQTQSQIHS